MGYTGCIGYLGNVLCRVFQGLGVITFLGLAIIRTRVSLRLYSVPPVRESTRVGSQWQTHLHHKGFRRMASKGLIPKSPSGEP